MGWAILLAIGAAAMAGLIALRLPRLLWSFAAAGLMLGAAGYALQGRPTVPGSPAGGARAMASDDGEGLATLRDAMFGRFTADGSYLVAADAMMRVGEPRSAVRAILLGIRRVPDSGLLWTGLGTVLSMHDGQLSPPARFAFARARRLAPQHPGPVFFEGMAAVRDGDLPAARALWRRALALTPPGVEYRAEIAGRLALLDRLIAMQDAGGR